MTRERASVETKATMTNELRMGGGNISPLEKIRKVFNEIKRDYL